MELEDLVKKVRKTELLSLSLSHQKLAGMFRSSFKGRGISINSVRKYEYGDDVRDINWHVTARIRDTYINTFTEDKERVIWIAVDMSASLDFGSQENSKVDQAIELAATIAYSALSSNDRVGLLCFNDKIERLVEAGKGMNWFWRIARELSSVPVKGGTDLKKALSFINNMPGRPGMVFLISDFRAYDYAADLRILAQKHEVCVIRLYDRLEKDFPKLGWLQFKAAETGVLKWVNTSTKRGRAGLAASARETEDYLAAALKGTGIPLLQVETKDQAAEALMKFMVERR